MIYSGGLIDQRKEKKDFSHLEIGRVSQPTYLTRTKALKVITKYPARNQKSTSSCGGHAGEIALSIDTNKIHEPAFIYRQRANFPDEGMYHYDLGDVMLRGTCLDKQVKKTEPDFNAFDIKPHLPEASKYPLDSYIVLENDKFTIDDIAYVVNDLKRPLILYVFWSGKEWSTDYPVAVGKMTNANAQYRHYVTVLPNSAYTYKKQKFVIIQDSAHFGGKHIRHLSEDWINKRIYTGLYFTSLIKEIEVAKPITTFFTKDLQLGDSNFDVKRLQEVLQNMGFFPANIKPTGYFGGITRQAVKDFQKKYEKSILWTLGLKTPTGFCGKRTRDKLNSLLD
tara:strand:+ start:350 stop:1360 length:1011 start_codon:yes stop_codon:yes gene_type:complete